MAKEEMVLQNRTGRLNEAGGHGMEMNVKKLR
jgi:hypothetical protein